MTPDTITSTGTLISQDQYNQYTANWLSAASGSGPTLASAFKAPGIERLLSLAFPIERIKWLVSAVGVRQIKARFLLVPDAHAKLQFTLALFATDAEGARLSAYYLPEAYWETAATTDALGDPIPSSLAATWLANWTAVPEVTPALFATSWGPLEGYNFDVSDFVSTLFNAQSFESATAYLGFGLHEYHSPTATEAVLTRTFGLVLQLAGPGQTRLAPRDEDFFDMATPCPPNT
jgi:hypothetical protein